MADFDEMRLVFKVPDGFVWKCPCGLGAKAPVSTAGKARIGARDHINRRHPKAAPPESTRPPDLRHASGMPLADAEAVLDAAARFRLRCEVLEARAFQDRLAQGPPGRFDGRTLERLREHFPLADQAVLLWSDDRLIPKAWLAVLETLQRRRYVALLAVPDWDAGGPKAVVLGATRVPEERCTAYIAGDRRTPAATRSCPNPAERITVVTTAEGRQLRTLLCKLHHRSQPGIDLGQEGGDSFVTFAAEPRAMPATLPPVLTGGARPAPPRPAPAIPSRAAGRASARPAQVETPPQALVPPAPPTPPAHAPPPPSASLLADVDLGGKAPADRLPPDAAQDAGRPGPEPGEVLFESRTAPAPDHKAAAPPMASNEATSGRRSDKA